MNSYSIVQFTERLIHGQPVIRVRFRRDSPIITWLAREDKLMSSELIYVTPEFKGLWEADRRALDAAQIELLCLMTSKGNLIGILALSRKKPRSFCSTDDVDMLMPLANDVYGHLAGDDILRQVAQHVKGAVRRVDIGVRYGGDEFAIILPQTSLDDTHKMAEEVGKRIELQMDSKGVSLTCGIGIASWPTDGVMREEIVRAADAAPYNAKQIGKNRICMASEVALSQVLRMDVQAKNKTAILSTIYALAATVDAKDHHTYGHSKKVSKYAIDIAEALGYSQGRIATIRAAALLHDIGKIGISSRLLEKPGPLGPDEWEPIRAHPNLGVAILKHVDGLKDCLAAVQYHHEHYDGTGYPAGLKGDNIPLDARILTVADAYDAMTSLRPYRNSKLTHEQALQELERCAGTQFDPTIVQLFASLYRQHPPGAIREKPSLVAGDRERR